MRSRGRHTFTQMAAPLRCALAYIAGSSDVSGARASMETRVGLTQRSRRGVCLCCGGGLYI